MLACSPGRQFAGSYPIRGGNTDSRGAGWPILLSVAACRQNEFMEDIGGFGMNSENHSDYQSTHQFEKPGLRKPSPSQASMQTPFDGPPTQVQLRLPQDLVQSLRLHSISEGKTMSQLVLECCISETTINKAWISTRKVA